MLATTAHKEESSGSQDGSGEERLENVVGCRNGGARAMVYSPPVSDAIAPTRADERLPEACMSSRRSDNKNRGQDGSRGRRMRTLIGSEVESIDILQHSDAMSRRTSSGAPQGENWSSGTLRSTFDREHAQINLCWRSACLED